MNSEYQSEIQTIYDFYSQSLDNFRNLYIYLPPSYHFEPERCYPVLYMHDGQNIFSGSTSYSGSGWEIHQVADELIGKHLIDEIIIVGIAHQNEERLSEYAHTDGGFEGQPIKGKGLLYETFLIEKVKPFIESQFRVLKGPENTALMGSSMGGLVTFNIGLRHPEIFGKLGVLSPSFWWGGDSTLQQVKKLKSNQLPKHMWIDIGDAEGHFENGFREVVQTLQQKGLSTPEEMAYWIIPGGAHSEIDWMERVHCPLIYFFGNLGFPVKLELQGRSLIGIQGLTYKINPLVVYDSGFCFSPYPISYTTSNPEVLTVDRSGTLEAHKVGKTTVNAHWNQLKTSRSYEVVPHLSSEVHVKICVSVPEDTDEEFIFMGIFGPTDYPLERTSKGFSTQLTLKRDSLLSFKFTLGSWDTVEKDSSGNDIHSRRFVASDDTTLYFNVERWF